MPDFVIIALLRFPHYNHWRPSHPFFCISLQIFNKVSVSHIGSCNMILTLVRLALLVVVLHIVERGEGCVSKYVVALCARIVHRLVGVD